MKITNLNELKEQVDIVNVIGSFIPISKKGAGFEACCPFHEEKTPSFKISKEKNLWHCFGCQKSGDAFSFVQEYKNLDFIQACEAIASIENFTLTYDDKIQNNDDSKELKLINDKFVANLSKVLPYVKERGLSDETIAKFGLGFGVGLTENKALQEKYSLPLMQNRLTFPIKNRWGKIIGYGGRSINGQMPKYINTKTNASFNKSAVFYGLDLAYRSILHKKEVLILEGYMDVIVAHQIGINIAVGVLGVALTKEHLANIRKMGVNIGLFFDKDTAGTAALNKSIELLMSNHFYDAYVLEINTKYKDIAEIAQKDPQAIKQAQKTPIIKWFIKDRTKGFNELSLEAQLHRLKEIKAFLDKCENNFLRMSYLKELEPLGILKISPQKQIKQESKTYEQVDTLEASIIKACYNNASALNLVKEFLDLSDFITTKIAYQALLENDQNNEKLKELIFLETPPIDLKQAINTILNKRKKQTLQTTTSIEEIVKLRNELWL